MRCWRRDDPLLRTAGADPRPRKIGRRDFSNDDVRRVRFVKQAQGLGFTLKEIAELLALRVSPTTTCTDVRTLAEAKLADIEEKLRTLKTFKKALGKLVRECSQTGAKGACPILDAMDATKTPTKKPRAKGSSIK